MPTKRCFKCHDEKPLDAFYRHPSPRDGHLGKCRVCTIKDTANWRKKNDERYRAFDHEYRRRPTVMTKHNERVRAWRSGNGEKTKAQSWVNHALRDGRLASQPCRDCGAHRVHGHHPDYSRPTDVIWLCAKHHRAEHLKGKHGSTVS